MRLVAALTALRKDSNAFPHLEALGIRDFAAVTRTDYAHLAELDRIARTANYLVPA